jgi:hypothetical protein
MRLRQLVIIAKADSGSGKGPRRNENGVSLITRAASSDESLLGATCQSGTHSIQCRSIPARTLALKS